MVDPDTLRHRVANLDGERNSDMREQEFKARDKTVNKMSRDGLVEENLQKKDSVRISQRELDNLTLPGQAADSVNFQRKKRILLDGGRRTAFLPVRKIPQRQAGSKGSPQKAAAV